MSRDDYAERLLSAVELALDCLKTGDTRSAARVLNCATLARPTRHKLRPTGDAHRHTLVSERINLRRE